MKALSFFCESMHFHPCKELFQVAGARDRTTDPWITKPVIYIYTMGDPLVFLLIQPKWEGGGEIAPPASPFTEGPVMGTPLIMSLILLSIAWK